MSGRCQDCQLQSGFSLFRLFRIGAQKAVDRRQEKAARNVVWEEIEQRFELNSSSAKVAGAEQCAGPNVVPLAGDVISEDDRTSVHLERLGTVKELQAFFSMTAAHRLGRLDQ